MHAGKLSLRFSLFSLAGLALAVPASAVIINGPAGRNTSAPTGDLAHAGYQYEGQWGAFTGTPIAPNYFITASHIGGSVGQAFSYAGQSYNTTAVFDDPNSDLRIYKVDGTFSSYAPLSSNTNPAGSSLLITGRGTERGAALGSNGYAWGAGDGALSWGTNTAAGTVNGGAGVGTLLQATFSSAGGPNQATLSSGDSGGGVFLNDGSGWKLAGINYAVQKTLTVDGAALSGALYGQSMYSSSIAADLSWIDSVVGDIPAAAASSVPSVPEPASAGLLLLGGTLLTLRRRRSTR